MRSQERILLSHSSRLQVAYNLPKMEAKYCLYSILYFQLSLIFAAVSLTAWKKTPCLGFWDFASFLSYNSTSVITSFIKIRLDNAIEKCIISHKFSLAITMYVGIVLNIVINNFN